MTDPSQIPEYIDRSPAFQGNIWTHLESQLNEFHDLLFYIRPETLEEAVGEKNYDEKYASSAPKAEEPETDSRGIHEGVIPYSSQEDIDFLKIALPSTQENFLRARDLIERRELTSELLIVWGQLSYFCGRIESYWTLIPDKIFHLRGGKSNKDINNIQAQLVWYSKMILVAQNTISRRKEVDKLIEDEIRYRIQMIDADKKGFDNLWYEKFFNGEKILSEAFTDKRLYKKVILIHAENSDNLSIPDPVFLSQ